MSELESLLGSTKMAIALNHSNSEIDARCLNPMDTPSKLHEKGILMTPSMYFYLGGVV
jgi:hypothetical protein